MAYKLELSLSANIHSVFRVSLLKRALPRTQMGAELPTLTLITTEVKPFALFDRRVVKRKNAAATQW